MNTNIKQVVYALVLAVASLTCVGCVFWQLTADRLVAHYELEESVLHSVMSGDRLYLSTGDIRSAEHRIKILDVSDPLDLKEEEAAGLEYLSPMQIDTFAVYDDFLIVTQGPLIIVIDTLNYTNGQPQTQYDFHDTQDTITRCVVFGDYLLRFANSGPDYCLAISIYSMADILDNSEPALVANLFLPEASLTLSTAAAVTADLLCIVAPPTFYIIDLSDVTAPNQVSNCSLPHMALTGNKLIFGGDRAYVLPYPSPPEYYFPEESSGNEGAAVIVDIANSSEPKVVCSIQGITGPCTYSGDFLLARSGESIDVYDLTNFAEAKYLKTLNVRLASSAIYAVGDFAVIPEARFDQRERVGVGTVVVAPYQ